MLTAEILEEQVLESLQGRIWLAGNCQCSSLVLRRVDLYLVLKSVVIDVVCRAMAQSACCVICFICAEKEGTLALTYSEPIVARIPLGRPVRTSFLHMRYTTLLAEGNKNGRAGSRLVSVRWLLVASLCTQVAASAGLRLAGWLAVERAEQMLPRQYVQ
jgi:hypothetical protein